MSKEKIKVYLYTRVSTNMQIDGYSLDAQKTKMKAFCDYNEYEIAGEYEDAGKSGKSIEGRRRRAAILVPKCKSENVEHVQHARWRSSGLYLV